MMYILNMENKLETYYRKPSPEEITLTFGTMTKVVTYQEFYDILKPIYKGSDPKAYSNSRSELLIDYMINGPKEQFSW